jgi:hypothetical protein
MPPISGQSPDAGDKICIDRETFRQLLSLLNSSTDILYLARTNEIFIQCLGDYLDDLTCLDDFQISKVSTLLRVWLDVVPENLTELSEYLQEARETVSVIFAASQLGGNCN